MRAVLRLAKANPSALRFLVVGGIGFVITMVINYGLKLFVIPQHPVTALAIGTIVATVVSYWMNKKWSFDDRGDRHTAHEMLLFVVVSVIGIGLNSAPLYISRYGLGLEVPQISRASMEIADFVSGPIIGTLIAMVFRYWAMNKWVFPKRAEIADVLSPTSPPTQPTPTR
ncbi:GtrA family protein [Frigoribacterium faeni]|uniref:Putative flippase GtrA n=1 Tax=Frigoribacterium faeni TaxID=145483 RepID=A0A7W3JI77_9MICO|nr:GtrA family protein [Frigoribacterium faeni]MBA8813324.1 putative flippase GtrA [Frigoribacterium faeni]BFF14546.1 GtrA family protein [Microbacterium flavescens]GEK84371.1 sugar translocase [Frigoribacterium faeni]